MNKVHKRDKSSLSSEKDYTALVIVIFVLLYCAVWWVLVLHFGTAFIGELLSDLPKIPHVPT